MDTIQPISKTSIILTNTDTWDDWFGNTRRLALSADIWEHINPDTDEVQLIKPRIPTYDEVKEGATTFASLNSNEKEEWQRINRQYADENDEYKRKRKALSELVGRIQDTINRKAISYITDCDTPYQMLRKLKSKYCATEETREIELAAKFRRQLNTVPKSRNIEDWLTELEKTYAQCERKGLLSSKPGVTVKEFLDAIANIDQAFADQWDSVISRGELNNTDFPKIIQHFRNWKLHRAQRTTNSQPTAAFPATFQGQTTEENKEEGTKKKPCLCGNEHAWRSCLYLIPILRSKDWKADPTIQAKVDEQMKKPHIQKIVTKLQKKITDKKQALRSSADDNEAEIPMEAGFAGHEGPYLLKNSFILDSGATTHICNNRQRFEDFVPASNTLYAGDGKVQVEGYGNVWIKVNRPSGQANVRLVQVAYIPEFQTNTISFQRLKAKGIQWNTEKEILTKDGKLWCQVLEKYNQFVIDYQPMAAFPANSYKPRPPLHGTIKRWHQRMGHLYEEAVKHLLTAVNGATIDQSELVGICEICRISQAPQQISRRKPVQATRPFQRVHFDLIQFQEGFNGDHWILHFVDEYSKFHFVYTLRNKSDATRTIKRFTAFIWNQYKCKIQIFHTDGERSLGNDFTDWIATEGISIEITAPDTPAQNGSAERSGGVIINRARALGLQGQLPSKLWPELARTAAHLLNRSPVRQLEWKTPYEVLHTAIAPESSANSIKIPNLSHLRIIGCKAYVRIPNIPKLKKMDPRALIGYLVGYEASNLFRIWVPQRRRVIVARDVTFDEDAKFNSGEIQPQLSPEIIELIDNPPLDQEVEPTPAVDTPFIHQEINLYDEDKIQEQQTGLLTPTSNTLSNRYTTPEESEQFTDSGNSSENNNIELQTRPRAMLAPRDINLNISESNIVSESRQRKPRSQAYTAILEQPQELSGYHAAFTAGMTVTQKPISVPKSMQHQLPPPPKNWKEMLRHPHSQGFRAAAEKEFWSLKQRGTFTPVNRPKEPGKQILPLIWVFTYKFDQDGYLAKYKARLCIRGDLQKANAKDTYAATLAVQVFRALMAITAAYNLEAKQLDAVNAFINSTMDEEVYCECPPGYENLGPCLLVLRALYGLRRSPKLWYDEFVQALKELGMKPITGQVCLFTNGSIILFFYVDDIVLLGRNLEEIESFKKALISRYEMRDIGDLQWFLGIRIIRDRQNCTIWLSQDAYIDKLISKFNLEIHRPTYTPLPAEKLIPNDGQATLQQIYAFQQRIGSIMYAAIVTRPDAAYAVNLLSRFLLNPSQKHLDAANHCLAYLDTFRTLAIKYSKTNKDELRIFHCSSDAAFADNPDRKSSNGYLFKLYGSPIAWKATKQSTITTSSTEAELLALSTATKEAIWWQRLFKALSFDLGEKLQIDCDNLQTIRLLADDNPILSTKLKHVDIHQHWLRQEVQAKRINIQWVPTSKMPADGLTKPLTRQKQESFIQLLGLVDIKDKLLQDTNKRS